MRVRLFGGQFHRVRQKTFSPDTNGNSARMAETNGTSPSSGFRLS